MADQNPTETGLPSIPPPADVTSLEPATPGISKQIGHYHIRRLIGSGGMGEVYEAMQEQPRRLVALKVMRPGIASASSLHRFEYESQVLARLQHPGIAQIFEAGTHRDPRYPDPIPYFAMEYIAMATPITEYADEHNLSQPDRLALMARVCDAVAHGHSKGIIHRDLKPSNILVDSEGNPKIIDFGVARGTDSDLATLQTSAGQIIGTLQYMSPEQCSDDPRTLDHRSDIYSLGIILFELLCGRLPYDVARRPLSEATRIIRETPSPLPSSLSRDVRGDAETIILRAIDKNRDRRYQTAAELKEDIDRCIAGDPVLARRDSSLYVATTRLRGITARNRPLAAVIAVVLAAVVAQTLGPAVLARWSVPNRAFETFCDRLAASPISKFDEVRLIALTDANDIAALAKREGLEGVEPGNVKSFRRLHGRLLERLAKAQPGVVMLDIKFRDPTPFDEDMAAGARSLSAAGTDTVVACPGWEVDAEGSPTLSPALAAFVRWGSASSSVSPTQVWRLQLAVRPPIGETMMSITLRALTCLQRPGLDAAATIDPSLKALRIQAFRPNPRLPGVRAAQGQPIVIPVTARPLVADEPAHGLHTSDIVAYYQVDPPADPIFAAATWDYARVFTESPEALRSWCTRKAVIIYDARAGIDRHDHPSGRRIPGAFAHATGLEQLLRHGSIRTPSLTAMWALTFLSAALALPFAARGRAARCAAAVGILLVLMFAAAIVSYRFGHLLASPIIPGFALVLCAGIVLALPRPRARRV